jgi:plasmid stabilization system protein ParE
MDSETPTLTIIRAPSAIDELDGIWRWNTGRHGLRHADRYLHYLEQAINKLSETYTRGMVVSTRPDLRYVLIRRRTSGHGHVVVYNFDENEVHILHVFHTAQDWRRTLLEEKS